MMENESLTTIYSEQVPLDVLEHSQRVGIMAFQIANELNLSRTEKFDISMASFCHDFGKSRISADIIKKPGKLTPNEFAQMKEHAFFSSEIVKLDCTFSKYSKIVLYHHEYIDGSGYYGLKKDEIPFLSRIIVVADIFDALCSDRVYRNGYTTEEALDIILSERHKYDAEVFHAFLNVIKHKCINYNEMQDNACAISL